MKLSWTLKKFPLSKLKEYKKNPRTLSENQYAQLKTSLDKFGLIDKPIVNLNGQIICGHQRKRILEQEGVQEIECWIPNRSLSEKEVAELNIRHNQNTGSWDFDALANQWEIEDLLQWGFTNENLCLPEIEPVEEDNEILEPGKDEDAITKSGDRISLGNHIVVCGDSTNGDIVAKTLGDAQPILMVTDPPYGVDYDPKWRKDIKEKHGVAAKALGTVQNDDKVNWALAWHLFPGSVAYIWHAALHTHEVYKSLTDSEYKIINHIIWVKQHFALSRGDYHWQHEPCWYAVKKGHKHNWQGARDQSTVWEISNLNAFGGKSSDSDERTAHSTQKPLECMARPILNNTAKGEGVYDPFLGSGTTLIACEQLDRRLYGLELSPSYCDIIIKRWIKYRQKQGKDVTVKCNGTKVSYL